MTENFHPDKKLRFPINCHYRIIYLDVPNIDIAINKCLKGFETQTPLEKGNISKKGKYLSFGVDININSKEEMRKVNDELLKVHGVKMVL